MAAVVGFILLPALWFLFLIAAGFLGVPGGLGIYELALRKWNGRRKVLVNGTWTWIAAEHVEELKAAAAEEPVMELGQ